MVFCVHCIWNTNISHVTHRELRERRPWKASEANSDIWLLLKSLWRKGPKENKQETDRHRTRDRVSEGGREGEKSETLRSAQATSRSETQRSAQYMYLLMYSHPPQLLIRRKSPSWDHLDGVLLQSSGTKHTHRPLRSGINIPLSQCYLCCILDWCSFPVGGWGGSGEGEHFQIRHFDDRCQSLSRLSELLPSLTSVQSDVQTDTQANTPLTIWAAFH